MKYEPTDVQCPDEAAVPIAKIHCGVYDRGRRARLPPSSVPMLKRPSDKAGPSD